MIDPSVLKRQAQHHDYNLNGEGIQITACTDQADQFVALVEFSRPGPTPTEPRDTIALSFPELLELVFSLRK